MCLVVDLQLSGVKSFVNFCHLYVVTDLEGREGRGVRKKDNGEFEEGKKEGRREGGGREGGKGRKGGRKEGREEGRREEGRREGGREEGRKGGKEEQAMNSNVLNKFMGNELKCAQQIHGQ